MAFIYESIAAAIVDRLMDPIKRQMGYLFCSTKHVRNMNTKMEQLETISQDVKRKMETNRMRNLEIPADVPGWLTEVENTIKNAKETKKDADNIPKKDAKETRKDADNISKKDAEETRKDADNISKKDAEETKKDADNISKKDAEETKKDADNISKKDVKEKRKDADNISSNGNGCFNIIMRYRAGKDAFNTTEDIDRLINRISKMTWDSAKKFLVKENSNNGSTSAPAYEDAENYFKSNEKPFNDALGFLQPDHKSQVIALHGMGGVGKSTLMKQLKKTLEDRKTYELFMEVVIGETGELFNIQRSLAEYLRLSLTEMDPTIRAGLLNIAFSNLPEDKKKVLVILDDVWKTINLDDIGLNPWPKGLKLLLTSRKINTCRKIAEDAKVDFEPVEVELMKEPEAQNLFWQIAGDANKNDKELNRIGTEIVRQCGFLPLAINIVAGLLRLQFEEKESVWLDTLDRLKNHELEETVQESIKISYDHIKKEEETRIFLLCGLFSDDFNIPIEELTRYAWGLNLLNKVYTLVAARNRTKTCVNSLRSLNLLMDGDHHGCVKMHDLVLDFVIDTVSKGDHPWLINHGDISKWSKAERRESCKRISITCTGMSEFPTDFGNPNVSLLRLMDGDKSLKFPANFYERMENLEVIAYEEMQYPLLPKSLHCFPKLRTLILHQCLLMFDCSVVGELLHLEVLSFAHCGIRKLPVEIGKLKELKLLDLTGCVDLRIDDGVLKKLVKLEELYMKTAGEKAIRFTDGNREEFAECSKHLSALEVEFFENNGLPQKMLSKKPERFKISMGCRLKDDARENIHSFENTLMLVTNQDELLDSGLNELFQKTEVLYLEVDGMNDLEAVQLPQHSFDKLRVLYVFKCANLKYLFTVPMANGLMKLERLTVSQCPDLEVLIYGEKSGDGVIKFQGLKFLSLTELPELVGICNNDNVSELPELVELILDGLPTFTSIYPEKTSATSSLSSNDSAIQPFFNTEVSIPKLKILKIFSMNKLKDIWPHQVSSRDEVNACMLREIEVRECDNIVNLFPRNPMSLLCHLEELRVGKCGSIEVLFDIDMSCVGEIEEYSSNLRHIEVFGLGKLRELWRVKGLSSTDILIRIFGAVERIEIKWCECFVNVFTPSVTKSDARTLMNVSIDGRRLWGESGINIQLVQKSQEIDVIPKGEISEVHGDIRDVGFSSHPIPMTLNRLQVWGCKDVEVVFEIESSSSNSSSRDLTTTRHNHDQPVLLLPHLKRLDLWDMERMSDVWKCNWNKLVIPQNQSQSSFHNLTTITLSQCHSIKYLFSPLMGKLLPNLKEVWIEACNGIEEVVSDRDVDENEEIDTSISTPHTNTISFPLLETLSLLGLRSLKSIDGGNARGRSRSAAITTTSIHHHFKVGVASWFLCQHSKNIEITKCDGLSRVFPSYVAGQLNKLEELIISECESVVEIFEREEGNSDGSDDTCTTMTVPRSANMTLLQLPNLTKLEVINCERLKYIFTSSTLESLRNLKELSVEKCEGMQVIVKEDGEHTAEASKTIVFPHLKSLTLAVLPNAKGFFLGTNELEWKVLEKVTMYGCPQMMSFTSGHSVAPKLKYIHTGLGKHTLEESGLNFHLSNPPHEVHTCSTPNTIKLLQFPGSFSNLVEVDAKPGYPYHDKLLYRRVIFPCNGLLNLKNLEKLCIKGAYDSVIEEVFEVEEGTNDDVNIETQSVVVFHKLKEVTLEGLKKLSHMWKSNPRIVLNFPNLTKVSIDRCGLLGHVFTSCMVRSLLQLQELQISSCWEMDVIVKQVEDFETRPTEVVFPCLKSITLENLSKLKGFCLGKEAFVWPSLDTLEIKGCPKITVFTRGRSTTPKLKIIDATFGLCDATEDPNSFIKTKQQQGWEF